MHTTDPQMLDPAEGEDDDEEEEEEEEERELKARQLSQMGFGLEESRMALLQCDYDLERAANLLCFDDLSDSDIPSPPSQQQCSYGNVAAQPQDAILGQKRYRPHQDEEEETTSRHPISSKRTSKSSSVIQGDENEEREDDDVSSMDNNVCDADVDQNNDIECDENDEEQKAMQFAIQESLKSGNQDEEVSLSFDMTKDPSTRKRDADNLFVGLKNVGNSCWFNALLFTYFMIPAVRMSILGLPGYGHFKNLQQQLQEQEQSQMSGQLQQQSADNVNNCRATHLSQEQIVQIRRMAFLRELQRLFMFMMFSNRKSINPSRLLKKLLEKECGAECAEMGSEEDIVEYNDLFLEKVEAGLSALSAQQHGQQRQPQQQQQNNVAIEPHGITLSSSTAPAQNRLAAVPPCEIEVKIKQLFYGTLVERVEAREPDGTDEVREKEHIFKNIIVYVNPEISDLYESLEDATHTMVDYTTENEFKTRASKTTWLKEAPPIVMFQISRTRYEKSSNQLRKFNSPLHFDKEIFLDRYFEYNHHLTDPVRTRIAQWKSELSVVQQELDKLLNYRSKNHGIHEALESVSHFLLRRVQSCSSILSDSESSDSEGRTPSPQLNPEDAATLQSLCDDDGSIQLPKLSEGDARYWADAARIVQTEYLHTTQRISHLERRASELKQMMKSAYDDYPERCREYTLISIVMHSGSTGGHYWCYVRKLDSLEARQMQQQEQQQQQQQQQQVEEQWIKFNDTEGSYVDESTVMGEAVGCEKTNTSAYCLVYIDLKRCPVWDVSADPMMAKQVFEASKKQDSPDRIQGCEKTANLIDALPVELIEDVMDDNEKLEMKIMQFRLNRIENNVNALISAVNKRCAEVQQQEYESDFANDIRIVNHHVLMHSLSLQREITMDIFTEEYMTIISRELHKDVGSEEYDVLAKRIDKDMLEQTALWSEWKCDLGRIPNNQQFECMPITLKNLYLLFHMRWPFKQITCLINEGLRAMAIASANQQSSYGSAALLITACYLHSHYFRSYGANQKFSAQVFLRMKYATLIVLHEHMEEYTTSSGNKTDVVVRMCTLFKACVDFMNEFNHPGFLDVLSQFSQFLDHRSELAALRNFLTPLIPFENTHSSHVPIASSVSWDQIITSIFNENHGATVHRLLNPLPHIQALFSHRDPSMLQIDERELFQQRQMFVRDFDQSDRVRQMTAYVSNFIAQRMQQTEQQSHTSHPPAQQHTVMGAQENRSVEE